MVKSVGQSNMRLAHHLLLHRSGVWHFRLIVPRDLHASLGRRVIKKSLGTRDPATARLWAYTLGAHYASTLRQGTKPGAGDAQEVVGRGAEGVDLV